MTAHLHLAPSGPPVSPVVLPGDYSAGSRFDADAYRRAFPDLWSAFLHAHFQSPVHAAFFFNRSEKTARDWWDGLTGPNGAVVGHAFRVMPKEATRYLVEAA